MFQASSRDHLRDGAFLLAHPVPRAGPAALHTGRPVWIPPAAEKGKKSMKVIYNDGTVKECPQEEELHVIRHTAAHVMAQAIKRLYPHADFAFGPATENGFYYDVDLGDTRLTDEDLAALLDWILSPQGQSIVEKAGYVALS